MPPLITDIDLSVDDRWLYVSAWGTGDLLQYDVRDPLRPSLTASVRLGGIAGRGTHPAEPDVPLSGGSQMVELSRDGRRVYVTNSLYAAWDEQFYPEGIDPWMIKLDADTSGGGLGVDGGFFRTAPTSGDCGCTRSAWRAATRPRTRTATAADHRAASPGDVVDDPAPALAALRRAPRRPWPG